MRYEMRRLSVGDDEAVYEMLQEIPVYENGFENNMNSRSFAEFKEWLRRCTHPVIMDEWGNCCTPQAFFWLYADDFPVGYGLIRHDSADKPSIPVGIAGYVIRPSQRNKGYGGKLLGMLVEEARKLNIDKLMLTIQNSNAASLKIALHYGGIIEETTADKTHIAILC